MNKDELLKQIPEFSLIKNDDLRDKTILAMLDAITEGGWEQKGGIAACPAILDPGYADCPGGWLAYTRRVVGTTEELFRGMEDWARTKFEIDHDVMISGALLSGIGKLTEYDLDKDGNPCLSSNGHLFRHPISGAWIAEERGLPVKVLQIIVTNSAKYSPMGNKATRTPESIFVKNADEMCMGILKAIAVDRTRNIK